MGLLPGNAWWAQREAGFFLGWAFDPVQHYLLLHLEIDILQHIDPALRVFLPWQVFHVPLEERRYKDNSQFGEGDEAKVCVDIMQKTGAHIELSLAKDQGLSIMVTGKLDSVMKARKEIVARLQTQVRAKPFHPSDTRFPASGYYSVNCPEVFR